MPNDLTRNRLLTNPRYRPSVMIVFSLIISIILLFWNLSVKKNKKNACKS